MAVTSSFSPETDLTRIKWKKNEATDLAKQRAVNRPRTFPSLSFWQTQLCPSLSVVHTGLILPLCLSMSPAVVHWSLLTQNTSLCQGKATSLFSYSWHLDWHWFSFGLHLFSHLEFYFLGKVQRKTKKSKVLKMIEYSPSGFLYYLLLFSPHHELGLEQEQWDSSCPVCQYKLKQLQLKNHPQAKNEGYFPWLSSISLPCILRGRQRHRNKEAQWNQLTEGAAEAHWVLWHKLLMRDSNTTESHSSNSETLNITRVQKIKRVEW